VNETNDRQNDLPEEQPSTGNVEEPNAPKGLPDDLLTAMKQKDDQDLLQSPPNAPDLYTLFSAMTVLSQEVKLQGRAFRQLEEKLSGVAQLPDAIRNAMTEQAKTVRAVTSFAEENRSLYRQRLEEAKESAGNDFLNLLLDLRDRLLRGHETAVDHLDRIERNNSRGWFSRWRSTSSVGSLREATQALEQGYTLAIDRLESSLQELGITEIDCLNKPFDPQQMKAVAVEDRRDVPSGTVVAVFRRGYERNGRVYRLPEVRVSRNQDI